MKHAKRMQLVSRDKQGDCERIDLVEDVEHLISECDALMERGPHHIEFYSDLNIEDIKRFFQAIRYYGHLTSPSFSINFCFPLCLIKMLVIALVPKFK